jgi:hypothetical protein
MVESHLYDARWHPSHHSVGRYIAVDDRARSDNRSVPDGHTAENSRVDTKPNIGTNTDVSFGPRESVFASTIEPVSNAKWVR